MPQRNSQLPKVGFVTYSMDRGGVENFLLRITDFLKKNHFAVEVVVTEKKGKWYDRIKEQGINSYHVKAFSFMTNIFFGALFYPLVIYKILKRRNHDILFLNHVKYVQGVIGLFNPRVKIVSILHNDEDAIYKIGLANHQALNKVVAVGERIFSKAESIVSTKARFIPYGVEIPAHIDHNHRNFNAGIRIIFAGRLENKQKGIFLIPDILLKCRALGVNFKMTIAGDGIDAEALKKKIKEKNFSTKEVEFVGLKSPSEIYQLYLEHHILLLPSYFEGLPISTLESQACGCVPVASHLPGITDTSIISGTTGFLRPVNDIDGFAEAIHRISSDPGLWLQMSKAANARIKLEFSTERMGQRYIQLIDELLSHNDPTPKRNTINFHEYCKLLNWTDSIPTGLRKLVKKIIKAQ